MDEHVAQLNKYLLSQQDILNDVHRKVNTLWSGIEHYTKSKMDNVTEDISTALVIPLCT